MRKKKSRISIIIPCYNEEKSIKKCIESCLNQTRKADEIIVVDDSSTDNSLEILKSFGKRIKVVEIKKRLGNKSYVQERGLKYIKGDIFIATDGDSVLDRNFVKKVADNFNNNSEVMAISGMVKSLKHNWLTSCRELDYVVGQRIHKLAQSYMDSLLVIPGCAGAFRTDIFRKYIKFDHDTLTEDLDFTYKFHENGLKISYDRSIITYTQDPSDIRSYIRQMRRWYSGGWQNLRKHSFRIINRPKNVLELSLIYIEGLVFSVLLFIGPLLNIHFLEYAILPYFIIVVGIATYAAVIERRIDLIIYSPMYFLLKFLNAGIFIYEFVNEIILRKNNGTWFIAERRALS